MLSNLDHLQIEAKDIEPETIRKQLENFRKGFPHIRLERHAGVGDGIMKFEGEKRNFFLTYYDQHFRHYKIQKFVPASGAASRMFKKLFEFLDKEGDDEVSMEIIEKDQGSDSVYRFIKRIRNFAFYNDLDHVLKETGTSVQGLIDSGEYKKLIRALLIGEKLGYAELPKALIKFHSYPDGARVAAEEHLIEAAHYASDGCRTARIHFTVSPGHIRKFDEKMKMATEKYSSALNTVFEITHSFQQSSKDTIAVDMENNPVRNPDGSLLFRPAGHGALLQNLMIPDADIIFIKNIDNIVPDRLKNETYTSKKLIGGYLLWIRAFIFSFLKKAENGSLSEEEILAAVKFAEENMLLSFSPDLIKKEREIILEELKTRFNRPIRICGMVKNEGEPGGGPFWVKDEAGKISLQIVESAQIDMNNEIQRKILASSTHFNPVDLVCCIKNYHGQKFILADFVDDSTGLISVKSFGGREIKAQELPGLWNGSMAGWITIFVEIPIITFNPVKTINDLLRDEHQ